MEYVEIGKSGTIAEGLKMPKNAVKDGIPSKGEKSGPPDPGGKEPASPSYGNISVSKKKHDIPRIPVYMDDDEVFVDYRKPSFWAYSPSVFMFFFGLILAVLFTVGGGIVGLIVGAMIFIFLMWMARYRLWARTGYWFTNHKVVIHDGSRTRLIPYDEIALSTLSFEGENCMFNTIYDHEIVLKGIVDMEQVVAFISRRVKEERKRGANSAPK